MEYVEKVYDLYARFYDFIFGRVFHDGRVRAPDMLHLKPGQKLLEVGVGTGLSLPWLPRNIEITGVDLSQKMLDLADRRVKRLGMDHVKLMKGDATALAFPDHSFDHVLAAYVVSVVPKPIEVVREMMRVCKPGGYMVIINHFCSEGKIGRLFDRLMSPLCYRIGFHTNVDLHKLMEQAGLQIDLIERVDWFGHWRAVRCVNPKRPTPA